MPELHSSRTVFHEDNHTSLQGIHVQDTSTHYLIIGVVVSFTIYVQSYLQSITKAIM